MTGGNFTDARRAFFRTVFGPCRGFVCIGTLAAGSRLWNETFWEYPDQLENMLEFVVSITPTNNVYFCPQVLMRPERKKEAVESCPNVWADLDTCEPSNLLVQPTITLETSPGRYQAFWVLDETQAPEDVEYVTKRIAYYHAPQGADKSGWDLTQMLRVPLTLNHKYGKKASERPVVSPIKAEKTRFTLSDFDIYPEVGLGETPSVFPMGDLPTGDIGDIVGRYKMRINPQVWSLISEAPKTGVSWSEPLWNLLMLCLEAGMSREETFVVARDSACNKYKRDKRPEEQLWKDVCRAYIRLTENLNMMKLKASDEQPLISEAEQEIVKDRESFVERYIEWASSLGDAARQYHVAGAFVGLSSILSGIVKLPTSFGTMYPNLWFMILADTTLTRKSTSMDIAMELISEVDEEILLATDGSLEGLFVGLTTRPARPSVFLRDEFSGLLEQMAKRDYLAGMPEMLTKLYDGKEQKRLLRKETLHVKDPRLIIYAGGIKSKIQSILTYDQVASGFLPRFLFITAESDINKVKPLGPPQERDTSGRDKIRAELNEIKQWYSQSTVFVVNGINISAGEKIWDAELTPDAWLRYNQLEALLNRQGVLSANPEVFTPVYDRLGKSILKAAILIAASRNRKPELIVDVPDIIHACYYGEQWRQYVREVITKVGQGQDERQLEQVYKKIVKENGSTRAILMRAYSLKSRDADQIFNTLEQRGLISSVRVGQTTSYVPVGDVNV